MNIQKEFFQAAATVLPAIFIAFAISSKFLDLSDPEPAGEGEPTLNHERKKTFIDLGGTPGIVIASIIVFATILTEAITLLSLAFGKHPDWLFYLDIVMFGVLAYLTALKVLEPVLLQAKSVVVQVSIAVVGLIAMVFIAGFVGLAMRYSL